MDVSYNPYFISKAGTLKIKVVLGSDILMKK